MTLTALVLLSLVISSQAYLHFQLPTKIFGPYIFIYDGKELTPPKGLIGGIPGWAKNGGANLVVLAFMDPIELNQSADIPQQYQDALKELQNSNLNVIFSMGGIDLEGNFQQTNPQTVAQNCAKIAKQYHVGIEIDCENDSMGSWIQSFITEYRSIIPNGGTDMSSILTMNVGASPGAFPNLEQVMLNNLNQLSWVNVMVYDPEQSPDNRQYWNYHNIPANQMTVARNLINTCDQFSILQPTLSYEKNGEQVLGIMFWAALSEETCEHAQQGAEFCGTDCEDCTAGNNSTGTYDCPALKQGCSSFGALCLDESDIVEFEEQVFEDSNGNEETFNSVIIYQSSYFEYYNTENDINISMTIE